MSNRKSEGDKSKRERQIEILSVVERNPGKYSVSDLCDLYHVEVATVQRDLRDLREIGLDIHSTRNTLVLLRSLTEKDYRTLLSEYLTSVSGIISFPKNISLTVRQLKARTLDVFTTLVRAIEKREKIRISYVRQQDSRLLSYVLEPYDVIPGNRDWRLIAISDGIFKQFIIGGIKEIQQTGEAFKRKNGYSADDYYAGSFGFFSGKEIFEVVLEFRKKVADVVSSRTWSEDQEITRKENGDVLLKMKVNSIEEIGSWILTWGGEVRVIEPIELKKYVLGKAAGILRSNGED